MKVLVLDPDWRFAQQARDYLEDRAHLVVHHSGGDRARDKVEQWGPDLVIVAAELCEGGLLTDIHEGDGHRPAVLLTGWMERYDRVWRMWQEGGDELLMKPIFNIDDLHDAIVVALENASTGTRVRPVAASA
ncbi:MAG: response regulator [Phycisphaerae bacterium]|nr:response regulator [Phycisphaerae bacterium]